MARIEVPPAEIRFRYARSSGPGGQNVNKVETKATLRWNAAQSAALDPGQRARLLARYAGRLTSAGELLITSQRFRDRERNREDCLARLAALLAAIERPPRPRRPTRRSRASVERRLAEKRHRAERRRQRSRPPAE
jgi:ribosome-associated protein